MNAVIVSTKASVYFAELLSKKLDIPFLGTERTIFGGGERYYRLDISDRNDLFGKDVIFDGSTHNDESLLEIIRVGETLATLGTRRRIFVNSFFGYSTMEREKNPGENIAAKSCARMLSNIPGGSDNTFLMMDLHIAGLVHYFEGDCIRRELYAENILLAAFNKLGFTGFMMATPDLGRSDWVESYYIKLSAIDMAFIRKARRGENVEIKHVIGDVRGKVIVIYDDMYRSGKTLLQAIEAYIKAGAIAVYVIISHLAANDEGSLLKLEKSPIEKLIVTNSHPMSQHPLVQQSTKIIVEDVSEIYERVIRSLLT